MNKIPCRSNNKYVCLMHNYFPVFATICLSLLFSVCVLHYAYGYYTPHPTKTLHLGFLDQD